ncbi:hypothetical protein QWZ06_08900 [Chryseobacterium tructae]|uniref:Uncharacterized protein n=1 Tax=Chryseobacterium tructae TaxID=1037380 RepID=A0ABV7XWT3_9FLAO|nr:hypothetical protein [Chryseobacterium tructae]MDN3692375.1 hypothetical protein [Chryseobacterium tructae]
MTNYKETGCIDEKQSELDEKFSKGMFYYKCVLLLSKNPVLKK